MEISDGMAAAIMYEIALSSKAEGVREKIFGDLRNYCRLDTMAMVKLRSALTQRAQSQ